MGKMPQHKALFAHNSTDPPHMQEARQWGGTGMFLMERLIPKLIESGEDEDYLGRWSWARVQGKKGHTVQIISAYNPSTPSQSNIEPGAFKA